ncbi:phenylalanine--tRNA ligase beta subunit-related protein [Mycoplasmopsis caviae]|uniref:B3/4 domain n=1 Tax=Mycoplasmopsis caviae TaxID=55603 RepID=A0A3P8MFE9_9BACT|nr:phenylalanine--tRNA ligase beta subunit-related protein [Mycoplasmopsis caviae]UUD35560.1 phenylalanine--tRNA ligase beta subunit-related protein [Mycoplasmopsis caviae]VDR41666.1 B3/4 domain [Mycoplasmopsis caviae]VDR42583.1 B3/4 domain [Mycoplasmopsis caviae]
MKKFIVEESFFELFPNARLGVVLIRKFNNKIANEGIKRLLKDANKKAVKYVSESMVFSDNPRIKIWRDAFTKFKTKKGARSSIEALLKRIEKGNPVNSINPLVDIYNIASLEFGLPCGAEDMKKIDGDLLLGITKGGDEFCALGEDYNSPTLEGEICYRDNLGAVCRCLNWRDGKRTMIDDNTESAFLVMEIIDKNDTELNNSLINAINRVVELSQNYLGAQCSIHFIDSNNPMLDTEQN